MSNKDLQQMVINRPKDKISTKNDDKLSQSIPDQDLNQQNTQ